MNTTRNRIFVFSLIINFALIVSSCSQDTVSNNGNNNDENNILVYLAEETKDFIPLTNYLNTSLRKVPPLSIADTIVSYYGKPEIIRLWLNLDEMWDYRTDEYFFNYNINKYMFEGDTLKYPYNWSKFIPSDEYFEDYLKSFCNAGNTTLLNVKRYQVEVLENLITMDQWKKVLKNGLIHYKSICPNLTYVEVLNESRLPQFGSMNEDQYYQFFKATYEVVNTINDNLPQVEHLKIGGPAAHGVSLLDFKFDDPNYVISNKGQQIYNFINNYMSDRNEEKRLDFISFHEYHLTDKPIHLSHYRNELDKIFKKSGLQADTEVFITEIGVGSPNQIKKNIHQAIGFYSLYKQNINNNIKLFPWVIYHTEEQQSLVMFDQDIDKTKFGLANDLFMMHSGFIVQTLSHEVDEFGIGVDILATKNENNFVLQYWNNSEVARNIKIELFDSPFLIDDKTDYQIYFLSDEKDISEFKKVSEIDSSEFNFTVSFDGGSFINSYIPSYSTVLIKFDE